MDENKVRVELVNTMFDMYPREYGATDDLIARRKAGYVLMLADLPVEAIRLAIRKSYLESEKVPSVARLVRSVRSLMGTVDDDKRVRRWDEAWGEIVKQMYACPYGKTPKWSTPEIEQAVSTYGWQRLQTVNAGTDFAVAESQIRRYYEQICQRQSEQEMNAYILSKMGGAQALPGASRSLQENGNGAGNTSTCPKQIEGSTEAKNG